MTEPTMEEKFQFNAELVIRTMREQAGMELAYDGKSVAWIEAYIECHRKELDRKTIDGLVGMFGSFLGECLRRHYGGRWVEANGYWGIEFSAGNVAFPFAKVGKQFDNGLGDSIKSFHDLIPILFKLGIPPDRAGGCAENL